MKKVPDRSTTKYRQLHTLAKSSRLANHSSVAILFNNIATPSLLMVQRAKRVGDPWSGDMAFPGGRQECHDKDHVYTALRELKEETGLQVNSPPLGELKTLWTKSHNSVRPMAIHPFVFDSPKDFDKANIESHSSGYQETNKLGLRLSHEIADAVWVPLTTFHLVNRKHFVWKTKLGSFQMPCFFYKHYKIWGLSLKMIENFKTQKRF